MASIGITTDVAGIRQAVKNNVAGQIIAISKNPQVLAKIAKRAADIMTPYVPMKTGALRASAHITAHARQTRVVWGKSDVVNPVSGISTLRYARKQYELLSGNRTTSGTDGYWDTHIQRGTPGFEQLVAYATPLVKKGVRKRGRR